MRHCCSIVGWLICGDTALPNTRAAGRCQGRSPLLLCALKCAYHRLPSQDTSSGDVLVQACRCNYRPILFDKKLAGDAKSKPLARNAALGLETAERLRLASRPTPRRPSAPGSRPILARLRVSRPTRQSCWNRRRLGALRFTGHAVWSRQLGITSCRRCHARGCVALAANIVYTKRCLFPVACSLFLQCTDYYWAADNAIPILTGQQYGSAGSVNHPP